MNNDLTLLKIIIFETYMNAKNKNIKNMKYEKCSSAVYMSRYIRYNMCLEEKLEEINVDIIVYR